MRPPLEECEAAAGVHRAGGEAVVIDGPAQGDTRARVLERLRAFAPDAVVLSLTWGSLADDLAFGAYVARALPEATVGVRGAPCFTDSARLLAENPWLTFTARGDYELVFESLVREGLDAAVGIERHGLPATPAMAVELDALPWADRSVIDAERYKERFSLHSQATVRVQRGCPYPCTYCLVATVSGRKARHRSPESVAAEMQTLRRSGVRRFYLRADTFSVDRRWAIAVSDAIAQAVPDARWVTTTRVDCVDDEVIAAMANAGCYGISFGVETGSRLIGEHIRKVPDEARTAAAFESCSRHGVLSLMYVMLGFLWETESTLAETASFVRRVKPDLLTTYWAHPYPGTEYHRQVLEQSVAYRPQFAQAEHALEPFSISVEAVRRAANRLVRSHYRDPRVLAALMRKLARHKWPWSMRAKSALAPLEV